LKKKVTFRSVARKGEGAARWRRWLNSEEVPVLSKSYTAAKKTALRADGKAEVLRGDRLFSSKTVWTPHRAYQVTSLSKPEPGGELAEILVKTQVDFAESLKKSNPRAEWATLQQEEAPPSQNL